LGFNAKFITSEEIRSGKLSNFDVLINGGGREGKIRRNITDSGLEKIREFVKSGGGFIGICAGAYLAINAKNGLHTVNSWNLNHYDIGIGHTKLEFTSLGKEIF